MHGARYLLAGIRLLGQPGIRAFVIVPLLINVLLFAVLISWAAAQLSAWVDWFTAWLPNWLEFMAGLLWVVFALLVAVLLIFGFTIVANLIAAPFNAFLSAAVQKHLRAVPVPDFGRSIAGEVRHSVLRELVKLVYYLPRALLLLVFSVLPLTAPVAPVFWLLFGGWMMALQYLDYPMDNNGIGFNAMRQSLATDRINALGFGFAVMLMAFIPLLNFLLMPAAVAGATRYWVEQMQSNHC